MLLGTSLFTSNHNAANLPDGDAQEGREQESPLTGSEFVRAVTASRADFVPRDSMIKGQVRIEELSDFGSQQGDFFMQEAIADGGMAVGPEAQPHQHSGQVGAGIVPIPPHEVMLLPQRFVASSLAHKTPGIEPDVTARSPEASANSALGSVATIHAAGANELMISPVEQIGEKLELESASQITRKPSGATDVNAMDHEMNLGIKSEVHLSNTSRATIMDNFEPSARRGSQQISALSADLRGTSADNQQDGQSLTLQSETRPSITSRPAPVMAMSSPLADAATRVSQSIDEPSDNETQIPLPSVPETQPKALPLANSAPRNVSTTQLPDQVAAQIRAAVDGDKSGSIEIRLDPEELGRLRIVLSPRESGMNVAIYTDTQETLELLRRNSGLLQSDFEGLGYEQASFTFEQENNNDQGAPLQTADLNTAEPRPSATEPQQSAQQTQAGSARLDLKL